MDMLNIKKTKTLSLFGLKRYKFMIIKQFEEFKNSIDLSSYIKLIESFQDKLEIGLKFKTTAVMSRNGHFNHFGINKISASLYGDKIEDIVNVECEVIEIGYPNYKPDNSVQYWGFYDIKKKKVSLIYPSWLSFYVCFPYGPKSEEERGNGYCVKMNVSECINEKKSELKSGKDIKDVISGLRGISKGRKEEALTLLKSYTKAGKSKIFGLNLHPLLRNKITKGDYPDGFDMGIDKNGYFIHTHRARSKSHESPDKISVREIKFIDSTG